MSEQTNTTDSTESSDIFISIKNILESDSNLCNFSRYMDYGKLTKDTVDSYRINWKPYKESVNLNLCQNNSQVIRIVDKLDSRFFELLQRYDSQIESYGTVNPYFRCCRTISYNSNDNSQGRQAFETRMLSKMVNIDCTYKITGSCLTALDFVNKNPLNTREEARFYDWIGSHIEKYILIGDKCFCLAIIDSLHNVYINKNVLKHIFTKESRSKFEDIVKKLFKVVGRYCYHCMNATITQFYMDQIMSPVMLICANTTKFDKIKSDSDFKKVMTFTFSDDAETDDIVRTNIIATIERVAKRYIEKYYDFSSLDFPQMVQDMKTNIQNSVKELTKKAYLNGLSLSNMFRRYGWEYCDMRSECQTIGRSLHYKDDHVYIKKVMNMVPRFAYCYGNRESGRDRLYRKLNDAGVERIQRDYGIIVKYLYIDITDGTMLMYGKHPNVSGGGEVCMGDIKGMISFDNCEEDKIKDNLEKCEGLLTTVNYTSSYSSDGSNYYTNDEYSFNVEDEFKQAASKTESEIDDDLNCSSVMSDDEAALEDAEETESPDEEEDDGVDDSVDGVEDVEEDEHTTVPADEQHIG